MTEIIRKWLSLPLFDEETKKAVRAMEGYEEALTMAFNGELEFGTGGLRGVLGVGTNQMNVYTVAKATQGLGDYLLKTSGKSVAIGYDTRHFSKEFAATAACVLAKNGLIAYVFDRQLPTPMLSFAVREMGCDAGIVITASHNPSQYNGYKVYGADGCQITDDAAAEITACIQNVNYENLAWLTPEEARAKDLYRDMPEKVYGLFIEKTLEVLEGLDKDGELSLVYTPLNGAGFEPVTDVLKRLNRVKVSLVQEQIAPDGAFPTCPSPNPELEAALKLGLAQLEKEGADLLIATDPDCDRVGVAVKDGNTFLRLTGNEVGLLLTEYILSKKAYPAVPTVIKTIVTSDLVFPIAKKYGASVAQVLTGFKYIGEYIGQMEDQGKGALFAFGFEESCGYLAAPHVRDKDGVMAVALVCAMARAYKKQGMTLADAARQMYENYGYLENKLLSFELKGATAKAQMAVLMGNMRQNPPKELAGEAVTEVKDYLTGTDGLPKSDVLSFATAEACKAIVRPSGTEPKVKVYLFGKAMKKEAALEKVAQMEAWFNEVIK